MKRLMMLLCALALASGCNEESNIPGPDVRVAGDAGVADITVESDLVARVGDPGEDPVALAPGCRGGVVVAITDSCGVVGYRCVGGRNDGQVRQLRPVCE